MQNEIREVLKELKDIKEDIRMIKENMPDKEMFLTIEEEKLLEQSYTNEQKGGLISSKDMRKELGI